MITTLLSLALAVGAAHGIPFPQVESTTSRASPAPTATRATGTSTATGIVYNSRPSSSYNTTHRSGANYSRFGTARPTNTATYYSGSYGKPFQAWVIVVAVCASVAVLAIFVILYRYSRRSTATNNYPPVQQIHINRASIDSREPLNPRRAGSTADGRPITPEPNTIDPELQHAHDPAPPYSYQPPVPPPAFPREPSPPPFTPVDRTPAR